MELPFLKNKQNAGVSVGSAGPDLMDSVADELFQAIEKKDIKSFRQALEALVLHIQDEDAAQDASE